MKYKDLIYKITSNNNDPINKQTIQNSLSDMNDAKLSLQTKEVLVGVMIDENTVLNKGISEALHKEVERTLLVLSNNAISESISFLPYDKKTLISMLELFPEMTHHFISNKEDFLEVKEIKNKKMNLKNVYASLNINEDFVNKIDYLVTVNISEIDSSMNAKLSEKNVIIFPMTFRGTENFSQKEKKVSPDPSGWSYNSASGIWQKNWGWDGSQQIPSWSAPTDWNLDPAPDPTSYRDFD